MSGCNRFLVNPGGWNDFSSGNLKRQQRRRKNRSPVLHTHKPRSIISCLLCACDHFQCLGLGGGLGVCACVTVGWWCWYGRASADLKMIAFSVALFPHYSLPLSFQSGPALLQLAAQIFSFVYILHGHTNTKVLSVWCFTSSFKPLCLLNAIFQLDCGLK